MNELTIYGLKFGPNNYFARGMYNVLGTFNDEPFYCLGKSGSQNLWLPLNRKRGLKVFHPKGYSGGEKGLMHYKTQRYLAEKGLAPMPIELMDLSVTFEDVAPNLKEVEPVFWNCRGLYMERVLSGGGGQVLRNLQKFGCNIHFSNAIDFKNIGDEALTLREYSVICAFYGGQQERIKEVIDDFASKIPPEFDVGLDLTTPANLVLDENGKCKVIDFDTCSV